MLIIQDIHSTPAQKPLQLRLPTMALPKFVLLGLLLALGLILRPASSSSTPLADIERMLLDSDDEQLPPSSTQPGPSNIHTSPAQALYHQTPGAAAAHHINLESSWQDILNSQQGVDHQTPVVHQPSNLFAQYFRHDQATQQEDASFLTSIGAPQYTPWSRTELLKRVRQEIYKAVGVEIHERSGVVLPFEESLSKLDFRRYAKESEASDARFGTWPLEINTAPGKTERFLVNQAHPHSELFVRAYGSKSPYYNHVYLDVWHEIQAEKYRGIYGYIGTMRAPYQFSKRKIRTFIPSAIPWRVIRPLSGSTVIAHLR